MQHVCLAPISLLSSCISAHSLHPPHCLRPQLGLKGSTADESGRLAFLDGSGTTAADQKRWTIQPRNYAPATGTETAGFETLAFKSDHSTTSGNAYIQLAIRARDDLTGTPDGVTYGTVQAAAVSGGRPLCSPHACLCLLTPGLQTN